MSRRFLALLLTVALLAACAPLRPNLGPPVSAEFAAALLDGWATESARTTTMRGLARVSVKAPLNNINGTQVILAEQPDHLRAETLTPFGVPLLTLAADGSTLAVSVPADNVYYTGKATPENLGMFVNLPLPPADLVSLLLYRPPLAAAHREEAFAVKDGGWLLVRHGTLERQELLFGPDRRLAEVSFFEGNDLVLKVGYGQFAPPTGFPHLLTLTVPDRHATVSLAFDDLETNAALRPGLFRLAPAPGARVVYLSGD